MKVARDAVNCLCVFVPCKFKLAIKKISAVEVNGKRQSCDDQISRHIEVRDLEVPDCVCLIYWVVLFVFSDLDLVSVFVKTIHQSASNV